MSEFPRPDLLFPGEAPYPAAQDPRPVFGSGNIKLHVPEQSPQTNLRFIYGIDDKLDRHALVEQIGDSEVIVYCSDWGTGDPDMPSLADAIEGDVRHYQNSANYVEGLEISDKLHPIIQTLVVDMQGEEREFYCAGTFEPHEDINALDIARGEAYNKMVLSIVEYRPVEESIGLMDEYTSRAAVYNGAVEERAYDQLADILREHGGQQVAVLCQNSFPLLPRYFRGDEAEPGLGMTRYHMPWTRLISNLVKADDVMRAVAEEKGEEFEEIEGLYQPEGMPPTHRPTMEQIIFLKQVGAKISPGLYYNALYSLIANYAIGRGDMYGPDVEYRMIERPHESREQLEFFERVYWPRIRGDNGESDEVRDAALNQFIGIWLQISI